MTSEVALTAALQNTIRSLQSRAPARPASPQSTQAPSEPPTDIASQALQNRASDLQTILDGIGQSIQVIKAAEKGIAELTSLLEQAGTLTEQAAQTPDSTEALEADFNAIRNQIDALIQNGEAGFQGKNLLNGDDLETDFGSERARPLLTEGVAFDTAGLGLAPAVDFSTPEAISEIQNTVLTALQSVKNFGTVLAEDLTLIQTRQTFATGSIGALTDGSSKLVEGIPDKEGAKLLALRIQQQLRSSGASLATGAQRDLLQQV